MTIELTVTSITVQPEISAVEIVVTPTFTSGGGLTAPILSISKNGVNIAPDELKNVDIEVPTKTSELTNDNNFVSDANYVHTDNNYDDLAVQEVAKIADKANSADVYTKSETYSQTEINNKLSAVYKFKGSVLTYDLLPTDAENADVWNVVNGITPELNGMNYAWNSNLSAWDAIGGIVGLATLTENGLMSKEDFAKLSDLYTKGDLDLILADKSDVGHNHSGEGINPDYIVLDEEYTDITMVALPVGSLFYNIDQLAWILKTSSNTYLNLGEENTYIAKNGDGATHLEGQVTYVTSGGGNLDVMTLASSANGKIDALLTQDVLHTGNGRGMYCFGGKVRTFPYSNVIKSTDNENTWVEGAELYLCSEAGRYSTTKEAAPAKCSVVGKITQRNGANISVSFRPFKAIAFEDLSNVDGTATTLADIDEHLFKDVVTGLWKKITHSNLVTKLATVFGKLATANTWSLLQTFTSGLKTTKIIPNSDTTGVVIRNAADTADVVKVDTANLFTTINTDASTLVENQYRGLVVSDGVNKSIKFLNVRYGGTVYSGIWFNEASPTGQTYAFLAEGNDVIFNAKSTGRVRFFANNSSKAILLSNGNFGIATDTPETKLDINGTTTLRDWVYLNNGTHTGDSVGDRRFKVVSDVFTLQRCTVLNATRGSGTWVDVYTNDLNGFLRDEYDDILPGMGWVDAAGGAAPDIVAHTIAGIAVNFKAFDGGTTTEAMTNAFEITHAIDIDALNRATAPLIAEIHTHGMAATAGSGVVKIFYDLVYQPVNAAPIAWGTFSNLITINANEQYWHKLGGAELTKPSSGYNIGDQIIVKYYRVPTDAQDTYTGDWLFKQCALHMPLNSNGSRQRYVK